MRLSCMITCLLTIFQTALFGFTNGGFETGDPAGWELTVEGGILTLEDEPDDDLSSAPFSVFDSVPTMKPSVDSSGMMTAVEGEWYCSVPGNAVDIFYPVVYEGKNYGVNFSECTIFLSQTVSLTAGDRVAGVLAFYTEETPNYSYDRGFILIIGPATSDTIAMIRTDQIEGSHLGRNSGWQAWEWTAMQSGEYTVRLGHATDVQEAGVAFFDFNRIEPENAISHSHSDRGLESVRVSRYGNFRGRFDFFSPNGRSMEKRAGEFGNLPYGIGIVVPNCRHANPVRVIIGR